MSRCGASLDQPAAIWNMVLKPEQRPALDFTVSFSKGMPFKEGLCMELLGTDSRKTRAQTAEITRCFVTLATAQVLYLLLIGLLMSR